MKCPLISIGYLASERIEATKKCECGKEKCAWWDEVEGGRCAILSLVGSLDLIALRLMHLEENMGGET